MSLQIGAALLITLLSALALNWGYLREHEAAQTLPPLSIRQPWRTARLLASSRRWLSGFMAELTGWLLFVLALAMAPLALVQAVSAGGIGILAALVSRFSLARLTGRARLGVGLSIAGLAMLGVSLAGGAGAGIEASWTSLWLWLGASAAAAIVVISLGRPLLGAGAAFGVATGVAFAAGDVATKATVAGDLLLAPVLVACYLAGTMLLQMGFQRGGALVTAGLATLLTNAIPIAAGTTIFHEPLPGGAFGVLRGMAFATVVVSAVLFARKEADVPAVRSPAPDAPGQLSTRAGREPIVRRIAWRYQQAEHGFRDLMLAVVCGAGGLAAGGIVLLAYFPTRAIMVVALLLAMLAALVVLGTVGAMLWAQDASPSTSAEAGAPEGNMQHHDPAKTQSAQRSRVREPAISR